MDAAIPVLEADFCLTEGTEGIAAALLRSASLQTRGITGGSQAE